MTCTCFGSDKRTEATRNHRNRLNVKTTERGVETYLLLAYLLLFFGSF